MQVAEKVNDSIGANIKELLAGSLYKACCVAAMFEIFFIEGLFFEWQYLYVACFMVLSPFGLLYFWGLQEKWGSCNLGEKFIAIMIVFIGITSFKTMVSVNSQIGKSYRSFIMQKETEDMPKEKLVTIDKFKDKLKVDASFASNGFSINDSAPVAKKNTAVFESRAKHSIGISI